MSDLHDEIVAIVYKHLPGKHDQKRHGWRFQGDQVGNARRSMRGEKDPKERAEYRKRAGMAEPKKVERKPEENNTLPALRGSEKQIEWANEIRKNVIHKNDSLLFDDNDRYNHLKEEDPNLDTKYPYEKSKLEARKIVHKLVKRELPKVTEAKFFIDNRGGVIRQLWRLSARNITDNEKSIIDNYFNEIKKPGGNSNTFFGWIE